MVYRNVSFEADEVNEFLKFTPWSGHRYFAYDLISWFKPRQLVELGTHYGCSFFAFAQSVKDSGLKTKLVAVDSWEGDHQAGFYGAEVYSKVNETIRRFFLNQNIELKRCYFDEALKDFDAHSIDVLHIDGCHEYHDVKKDFDAWLPKVDKNGIILMHDIGEWTNYGSHVLWKELKDVFSNTVEFNFSWGLGVIFLNEEVYRNFVENIDLRKYPQLLSKDSDSHKVEILDLYFKNKDLKEFNQFIENQLIVKENEQKDLLNVLEDKEKYIADVEKRHDILFQDNINWSKMDQEKNKEIQRLNKEISVLQTELEKWQQNTVLKEKYIEELKNDKEIITSEIRRWEENMQLKENYIKELSNNIKILTEEINKWERNLELKEKYIEELHNNVKVLNEEINKWQENVERKDSYIKILEARLKM